MKSSTNVGEAESSKGAHRMRIASGGSIQHYIAFALQFLKEHSNRPLILHTIPPDTADEAVGETRKSSKASSSLPKSLLATPKLISVVELIKRQYMDNLQASRSGKKGKNRAVGLWQYTTSGLIPGDPASEAKPVGLETVLTGRTKPALRHAPYLEITLSTRPIGLEDSQKDTTCQYVMFRNRRSWTAKSKTDAKDSVKEKRGAKEIGGAKQPRPIPVQDTGVIKDGVSAEKPKMTGKKRKAGAPGSTPTTQEGNVTKKLKSRG